jgi:tetratricopeptide (TPR) repeat protein
MDLVAAQAGLHEQRIEILDGMASDAEEAAPVRAALLRQAAQICLFELNQPSRAQALIIRALELCPHEKTLQLDRLAIAEQSEDWPAVAALLREQCDATAEPEERAALLHRMSVAYLRTGEEAAAAQAMHEATTALPGYLPVLADRERQALASGDLDALAGALAEEAGALESGAPGLPPTAKTEGGWLALTWWRAATAHRQLGDAEQAIEACRKALAAQPELRVAREELAALLWEQGRHRELADALEEQLHSAPADEVHWLLETLIALYGGPLDDVSRLIKTLQRLHEQQPDDRWLLVRLADAYERGEHYEELAAVLGELERIDLAGSATTGYKLRRAALYAGPLGRPEEAIALYQEILEGSPGEPYAFAAVEALLRREKKFAELAELIEKAAERTDAVEQRAQLIAKLGWVLAGELQDPQRAYDAYRDLLVHAPAHAAAPHDLLRAARATGDPKRVAEALELQLERTTRPEVNAELALRLGEVLRYGLRETERADEYFAKAAAAPTVENAAPALDFVAQRQLARGDLTEAFETLQRLSPAVSPELRRTLLSERAWVREGEVSAPEEEASL